ncbi:MAG: hypothetical protein RBQ97_07695 [Acholeplasma sp.]|nr:hypothetical protein [Acholeplasma sp.]
MQTVEEKIKKLNSIGLTEYVGVIDIGIFLSSDANILYYLFPLIEKTVLEILKFKYDTDVEVINQGKYRTLNSLIEIPKNRRHFSETVIKDLCIYFEDDGLRNKLMHYTPELDELNIRISEILKIKELTLTLLLKLGKLVSKSKIEMPGQIELL